MKVYVVMSNDFPDCVFGEEEMAKTYCKSKMDEQRKDKSGYESPRIYYRYYEFTVGYNVTDADIGIE